LSLVSSTAANHLDLLLPRRSTWALEATYCIGGIGAGMVPMPTVFVIGGIGAGMVPMPTVFVIGGIGAGIVPMPTTLLRIETLLSTTNNASKNAKK
jgi:hypothetical protein